MSIKGLVAKIEPNMAEEGEDVFEASLYEALNFLAERGFSRELRQEQKSSVKQLFTGGDLLAVLPTGFGKSLIFQVLALLKEDCVVVVICPLKSIVNDQIKEASSMGISAGSLSNCLQTDIESGKYRLLFASSKNTVLENPVISSGLLDNNMLSDFRYSDISSEAFLLTAFRTSGYNSECFVIVLAAACQFLSHICLTKHLQGVTNR